MVRDTQGNQQVVKTVRNLALNTFLVCGASFIEIAATVWLAFLVVGPVLGAYAQLPI